ncbi:MAG: endonuclease/exonuclease/phosphatase family protein [Candidatus Hydrogenedentes bacterium]|nr:endonuclease/exonuclease/phosphatase family protein [Candidatus Hydrogenedentota bacterium]
MRFLLYNIRYGTGADPSFHLPLPFSGYLRRTTRNFSQIAEFIESTHADVVGLLEVDSGSFRSRRRSQAEEIAQALGHAHVYQSKYARRSLVGNLPLLRKQGNAFLTGSEIKAQKFHYFNFGVKRLVLELELSDLVILLVHLSIKFRHRHYQLWELHALIKEATKPVLVAGDFNVFRGTREVELFLAATGLKNANTAGLASYPSWNPRRELDFVLHSPEIQIINFQAPRVTFSDHLPLICDLEIPPRPN